MSFGGSFSNFSPQRFPYGSYPLIAPYWADIDLSSGIGNVRYTVYTTGNINGDCYVDLVNKFLVNELETDSFTATSMLVAQWIDVCPYGNSRCNEVIIIVTIMILVINDLG